MQDQTKVVDQLVDSLPAEIQEEVRDFIESLMVKRARKPAGKLKLDWRGALRDMRDQYTSVELQHKAHKQ